VNKIQNKVIKDLEDFKSQGFEETDSYFNEWSNLSSQGGSTLNVAMFVYPNICIFWNIGDSRSCVFQINKDGVN
jgi:hypothetical protein